MASASSFERNIDINDAHIAHAIASSDAFRALLARASEVSRPEEGGPKLLTACAALVRAPWVDGRLRIELNGDDQRTELNILIEAGFRERLFPTVTLNVPLDEFVRAARLVPRLIAPLTVVEAEPTLILRQPVFDDVHTKPTVVRMQAVRVPNPREDD
jgi:hypothetical protein